MIDGSDLPDLALQVTNGLADALMAVNSAGEIVFWNEGAGFLFGYSRQEALGRPLLELIVPADRLDAARERLGATLRAGSVCYETERRRRDGQIVYVDSSMRLLQDARTGCEMTVVSERDVTQRKFTREAGVLEAKFKGLLEAAPDAMVIVNKDGRIILLNSHAERLFGYARRELIGEPIEMLVPEKHRMNHLQHRSAFFESPTRRPKGASLELAGRRKDGGEFPAEISLSPLETDEGMLVSAAVRDISDRKHLEAARRSELEQQNVRIQEANRLKSEFLANMSHELRTPLNAITGFAQMMHDGKVGPVSDRHREFLGDILSSAHHLLQLINDVLDLAKVESGKMEFHPEVLNVERLVNDVCDILRTLAASKRILVGAEIAPNLGPVQLDPGKLKQVLYNYLSNAFKFTPDGGRVVVRVLPQGADRVRFEVEDTGIGIRPENVGSLFVEFHQLDASASKRFAGTGLGLALTRRIVEAQGGEVGVRSAPGHGSVFFAILPRTTHVVQSLEEHAVPLPAGAPATGAATVLVIEDDPADRAWLARTIGEQGLAVEIAVNGTDALERCRARRFAAITLDLILPDWGGWDLLRAIRAEGPNRQTPVIVVTVVAETDAGMGFRIHDYLPKPATVAQLQSSLERVGLAGGGTRKVLVVDDRPQDLSLAGELLRAAGYQGICVSDGEEALKAAEAERPDAVLLDLLMPGMDGLEFLSRFRRTALGRHTPVIFWTARDLSSAERAHLQAEAQALVEKGPRGAAQLLEELRTLVRGVGGAAHGE